MSQGGQVGFFNRMLALRGRFFVGGGVAVSAGAVAVFAWWLVGAR